MRTVSSESGARKRTEVCITVDTEFSIAGAFDAPRERRPIAEPIVQCNADGSEQGLGFLLRTFEECGIKATFFVEALNYCYFGDAPMGSITSRILAANHDVQLHVHPCWMFFRESDWLARLDTSRPSDNCTGRSESEVAEILALGIATFARWGAPSPIAFRTGSLQADMAVFRAAARLGLKLSSSVGLGGPAPPSEPELQLSGGRRRVNGVLELPVLSYEQFAIGPIARHRLFTVTGTSFREAEYLLWEARRAGISPVVILTHPFEFAKAADPDYKRLRPNRVNQDRLRRLCQFIGRHSSDFVSVNFSDAAPTWLAADDLDSGMLQVPLAASVGRMIENKLNDWVRQY